MWNAHRTYGKYRLSLLTLGFRLLDVMGLDCYLAEFAWKGGEICQPILIMQRLEG